VKDRITRGIKAFTRIDLLVVVVLLAILLALLLPALAGTRYHSDRVKCVGHLKQSGLAFKIFSSDNDDWYPYEILPPWTNGTAEATISLTNAIEGYDPKSMAAWAHWSVLSNELGSPKILLCPGNRSKKYSLATDWSSQNGRGFYSKQGYQKMGNKNTVHTKNNPNYNRIVGYDCSISYFLSFDADEFIPAGILAGDFNFEYNDAAKADPFEDNPHLSGSDYMDAGADFAALTWVTGIDSDTAWGIHDKAGNLALTDGSVVQVNTAQLRDQFRASTNAWGKSTLHLLIPR